MASLEECNPTCHRAHPKWRWPWPLGREEDSARTLNEFCPCSYDKNPCQKQLKERCCLSHSSGRQSTVLGKAWRQECGVLGYVTSTAEKRDEFGWEVCSFSILMQKPPNHQAAVHMHLPTSVKPETFPEDYFLRDFRSCQTGNMKHYRALSRGEVSVL